MARRKTGKYITVSTVGETVRAFVPAPLPPKPPLCFSPALRDVMDQSHLQKISSEVERYRERA